MIPHNQADDEDGDWVPFDDRDWYDWYEDPDGLLGPR